MKSRNVFPVTLELLLQIFALAAALPLQPPLSTAAAVTPSLFLISPLSEGVNSTKQLTLPSDITS